jgi:hypothetical protein
MIDISFLGAATTSLSAARDIARSLIGLRDFNHRATFVSSLNEQILQAQDGLLAHNAPLFALQQENFALTKKLARTEEILADRGRYTLVEISDRTFVMGLNKRIEATAQDLANGAELDHYLCQPCFDVRRQKVVLTMSIDWAPRLSLAPSAKPFSLDDTSESDITPPFFRSNAHGEEPATSARRAIRCELFGRAPDRIQLAATSR